MKLILLLICCVFLTRCVVPNLSNPGTSQRPYEGMSKDQLYATWGTPWRHDWYRSGETLYETLLYRQRRAVVMPSWGGGRPTRHYETTWYTVHLKDGVVVGGDW